MPLPHPLRWVVCAVVLSLTLSLPGCITIPYKTASETKHDLSQVPNPERVRLSVGPRNFLDKMAEDVLKQDKRLQQVDGQTFIDAASPEQELTLERLLDPATHPLIEPLQIDYLVVLRKPEDETLGHVGGFIPFLGIGGSKQSTTAWAAVIDLRQQRLVEQLQSKSIGKSGGVLYGFYGVFVEGDTQSGAKHGVARRVAETIANERPTGPVRVVFLANEPIPSPEEARAAEAAKPLPELPPPWLLEGNPKFEAAAPPTAGEGLIYIYRPDQGFGWGIPLDIRAGTSAANTAITHLWNAGYFPFYAPTGPLTVWPASDPTHSVTLEVKPGETYYLRGSTSVGWSAGHGNLAVVDHDRGQHEVKKCKRLPSSAEADLETRKLAEQGYVDRQFELAALFTTGVNYANGQTLPQDDVEAYKWFAIGAETKSRLPPDATAVSPTSVYYLALASKSRAALAAKMDPAQIAEAEQRARRWIDAHNANQEPSR
jgi:hypothetical protein